MRRRVGRRAGRRVGRNLAGGRSCLLYESPTESTGSLLYELLLKGHGRPKSEVRCELRVHRRVSPGRGSCLVSFLGFLAT